MRISDWSSDVGSSDLRNEIGDQVDRRQRIGGDRDGEDAREPKHARVACGEPGGVRLDREPVAQVADAFGKGFAGHRMTIRSEERRVGKDGVSKWRSRWSPDNSKKKKSKKDN